MSMIFCPRGSVLTSEPSENGGAGFYRLDGFPSGENGILLYSCSPTESDIHTPMVTLEGKKILYKFGKAFGNFSISGELLLGAAGSDGSGVSGSALADLTSYFEKHRLSNKDDPTILTAAGGDTKYYLYLIGLQIFDMNTEFHTMPFTITALIADPTNPREKE